MDGKSWREFCSLVRREGRRFVLVIVGCLDRDFGQEDRLCYEVIGHAELQIFA